MYVYTLQLVLYSSAFFAYEELFQIVILKQIFFFFCFVFLFFILFFNLFVPFKEKQKGVTTFWQNEKYLNLQI